MNSYIRLFRSLVARVEQGRRVAVCIVAETKGSTPQSPGAVMLVHDDMQTEGTLGGGCVEAEVRRQAVDLLRQDEPRLLSFNLDDSFGWDDGLICGGHMGVAVLPIADPAQAAAFRQAAATLEQGRGAVVPFRALIQGAPGEYRLFIEPPARLVIAGAGHVGAEVARLAIRLDFDVFVIDDRADLMDRERLPSPIVPLVGDIGATLRRQRIDANTYVVIVTRGHQHDEQALEAVVGQDARYIGMIGSRRKVKLIFDHLTAAGVAPAKLPRVPAPRGLSIGSLTVPEIAVSIVAQLVQVRRVEKPTRVEGPFAVGC